MTITRAKATRLLNATEMGLYDDSRANSLRGHTDAKLARLITRARTARDRARDLEKRQRLASRTSTGSKSGRGGQANARTGEKAGLLTDILARLETRQTDKAKADRAAAKAAAPASKRATKKTATSANRKTRPQQSSDAAAPATSTRRAAGTSAARANAAGSRAKQATPRSAGAGKAQSPAPGKSRSRTGASGASTRQGGAQGATAGKARTASGAAAKGTPRAPISPARALKNTRTLLAQKAAESGQGRPWEELGADGTSQATPGYQSGRARAQALALHSAEMRQASINGSASTRDRRNQGKRDHRNKPD